MECVTVKNSHRLFNTDNLDSEWMMCNIFIDTQMIMSTDTDGFYSIEGLRYFNYS